MNEFNNLARYHPFMNAEIWQPPTIEPGGGTCLSFALNVALDAVAQRKDDYRMNGISYYRPWIVLLTDGYPEHDSKDELTWPSKNECEKLTTGDSATCSSSPVATPTSRQSRCSGRKSRRPAGHPRKPPRPTSVSSSPG